MTPLVSSALLRAQTDERLVALAAAGHDRAFEAIVERYRRPLLRYLRRLLSDTLAEDVVQATFLNAWSSLRTGTEVRDLRPWLYRIAHNAALNALKKVGEVMEEVPESIGGLQTEPATELERRDEIQRALMSIAALPSRQRAALLAVAVDGRAHAEVAAELGLTDGAVRQLVHRARTALRSGATAITPLPLLHGLVAQAGDSTVGRVAELAAGAGGAGAASLSLKAGAAAVLATGALVTGGPQIAHVVHPSAKSNAAPAAQLAARTPRASSARSGSGGSTGTPAMSATDRHVSLQPTGTSVDRHAGARGHKQRRRRHRSEHSGSSVTGARHAAGRSGDRSGPGDDSRDDSTTGRHQASGSSGADDNRGPGRRGGRGTQTSGRHGQRSGRRGSGGTDDGAAHTGATKSGGAHHGADDNLVVTPPTTSQRADGGGGGGGGSGGGKGDQTTSTQTQTTRPAPAPLPDQGGGGNNLRTTPDGGGG